MRTRSALAAVILVLGLLVSDQPIPAAHAESEPIKVGVLHSLTGPVAISEGPVNDATLLAIEEINRDGGLLGRRIEPVVVDGKSDPPTFAAEAERLITREQVSAIFGCYTSASRRQIVPIIEKHRNVLLYPTFYEGIESSPNVIYAGAAPNQHVIPATKWSLDNLGKRFFIVGSDYIYPRASAEIVKDQVRYLGGTILGEEYTPLGSQDVRAMIGGIKQTKPDVVLNLIVGDTMIPFYAQLRAAGITKEQIHVMSVVVSDTEMPSLNPQQMVGDYVATNYFLSIDSPVNKDFVARFRQKFGQDRLIGDSMEAAYTSVKLWEQAVVKAESTEPMPVLQAIRGQSYDAPEGQVFVDEENLHLWKQARVAEVGADGRLSIVWTSDVVIRPAPYSIYRTRRKWEKLISDLYAGWNNSWAKPS